MTLILLLAACWPMCWRRDSSRFRRTRFAAGNLPATLREQEHHDDKAAVAPALLQACQRQLGASGCVAQLSRGSHKITESQNGRGWKGPLWVTQLNPLPKQGHPEQAAQHRVQAGLEYLQRRRLHNLPGQPGPGLRHPQREEVLPHLQLELPLLQFVSVAPWYFCPGRLESSRAGLGRVWKLENSIRCAWMAFTDALGVALQVNRSLREP